MPKFNKFYLVSLLVGECILGMTGKLYGQKLSDQYLPNAHSHNDYTRENPFYKAYNLGFGSIEVDLFLVDGELYVAHDRKEIQAGRTFDELYLKPLVALYSAANEGSIYPAGGTLQLLIDPKTEGGAMLDLLTQKLLPYRNLFDSRNNSNAVKIVISGNKPDRTTWSKYDDIFYFDADFNIDYTPYQISRIGLFSAPLKHYITWDGLEPLRGSDKQHIVELRDSVHQLDKKIRFWAVPDTKVTWSQWIDLDIDYINTDQPELLSKFIQMTGRPNQ